MQGDRHPFELNAAQLAALQPNPLVSVARLPMPICDGQQETVDGQQLSLPSALLQVGGNQQVMPTPQPGPALQLPVHLQQWLATLAQDTQQAVNSSNMPDQLVDRGTDTRAPSPRHAVASAEVQEDARHLRAELADVKACFADTQVYAPCFFPPPMFFHGSCCQFLYIVSKY